MTGLYAVIRIRGMANLSPKVKDTLRILNLKAVNNCVFVPKTPDFEGMLMRVRPYITWGEVKPGIVEKMILERGRLAGNKKPDTKTAKEIAKKIVSNKSVKGIDIKSVFRLSPPKKGLKSIRLSYPKGDAGFRGEKINELLERMI